MSTSISAHIPKPRLLPIKVPWYVSPSTSFLRLTVGEVPDDCPTEVTFLSFCLLEGVDIPPATDEENQELQLLFHKDPRDRIVKLVFEYSGCARMYRAHSNTEVIQESAYDWSELRYDFKPDPDPDNWGEENFEKLANLAEEEWRQTGICPDPRVYEVKGSPWLRELRAMGIYQHKDFKQYLILGHSAYVEVIAKSLSWEFLT